MRKLTQAVQPLRLLTIVGKYFPYVELVGCWFILDKEAAINIIVAETLYLEQGR